MKGCFLLQRQFAYIGHALALLLKEKYGISEFCGYVYLRRSYNWLKQQTDINYSSLLLDEEIHHQYKQEKLDLSYLKYLEQEYGMPNLWHYIMVDRVVRYNLLVREYPNDTPIYTHEEMLRILQVKARVIINFLEKEKPDFIFFSAIGGIGSLLLYQIARKKGIKILHVLHTSIKNRFVISEQYDYFTGVENIFKKNQTGQQSKNFYLQAKKFLSEFRDNPQPYYPELNYEQQPIKRSQQLKFLKPKNSIQSLSYFLKIICERFTLPDRRDYTYIHPWNYFKDHFRRKIRNLIGSTDLYDNFDPADDYAFYPLHLEPEIATLLFAPYYTDQIHIIQQVAKSLPVGYKLYVKEHPQMVIYRPRSYYKELKKIPNLKLINPLIPGVVVINKAKIVTCVTGSSGWEATLLKKPVVVWGDIFYNRLSFVKSCHSYENLPYLIKEQLENFEYNEEELLRLLAALFEDSVDINLAYLWEREYDPIKKKRGLEPLADLIAKKINVI